MQWYQCLKPQTCPVTFNHHSFVSSFRQQYAWETIISVNALMGWNSNLFDYIITSGISDLFLGRNFFVLIEFEWNFYYFLLGGSSATSFVL